MCMYLFRSISIVQSARRRNAGRKRFTVSVAVVVVVVVFLRRQRRPGVFEEQKWPFCELFVVFALFCLFAFPPLLFLSSFLFSFTLFFPVSSKQQSNSFLRGSASYIELTWIPFKKMFFQQKKFVQTRLTLRLSVFIECSNKTTTTTNKGKNKEIRQ